MENQDGDQPDPDRPDQGVLLVAAERKTKERALLLMRYSGLAIQDAATLAELALEGDCLTLRKANSGTRVLRDRFALGLLAARVAMEDASVLLSHGTICTTDHYYAHGALSRRNLLLAQPPPTARQAL